MRQVHEEHVQLLPHATNDADGFAEVDLRMPRRMHQRGKSLTQPPLRDPHVVLHARVAASVAMLGLQPLEDPQRRVPLLRWRRFVRL